MLVIFLAPIIPIFLISECTFENFFQVNETLDQESLNVKFDKASILRQSKIFNPTDRAPNKFEAAINAASMRLCLKDGSLLANRQMML